MKRVARWFKTRRQLLAELRNLERAVNDYQYTLFDVDRVLGMLEDYLERVDASGRWVPDGE
ncbi:MAG: hypothetical protein QF565_17530 [Arenicellales bacterium]|nr:hypothetical protein [Arenicellales bacterium]